MPSFVGIDIGNNNCKIAVREGSGMRLISRRMPENMVNSGEVTAPETMASFLKDVRTAEHIHDRDCVLVLAESQTYFRHVTLPAMTVGELELNLPYEFRDFITGDPSEYTYDYAVDEMVMDETGKPQRLELFAAAAEKSMIEEYSNLMRKAGFRLKAVVPAPMAYSRLLRAHIDAKPEDENKDIVLVDIGHADVAVTLFRGPHYEAMKTIDFGCDEFDNAIADLKNIDPYTASSYKYTNFEGVLDVPECQSICDKFALEVNKVINFYNFNNPDKDIEQMYFLGGGAQIPQLTRVIADAVSIPAESIDALLPGGVKDQQNAPVCTLAIAGMLEGEAM